MLKVGYELQNGDVVNILSGDGKPALDWLRYATARSTKAKLRLYFRRQEQKSAILGGEMKILEYLESNQKRLGGVTTLEELAEKSGLTSKELCLTVGYNREALVPLMVTIFNNVEGTMFFDKIKKIKKKGKATENKQQPQTPRARFERIKRLLSLRRKPQNL